MPRAPNKYEKYQIATINILLEEVIKKTYLRSYNKRNTIIAAIEDTISFKGHQLGLKWLCGIVREQIPKIIESVFNRTVNYSTLNKIIEILQISKIYKLYTILEPEIISKVKRNKFKSFWLFITLIKTKLKLKRETLTLEDIFHLRYLTPNKNGVISSLFLENFINEVPRYNKQKMFKHCLKYRQYTDTYGIGLLDVFFSICPEYKKYSFIK